MDLRRTGSEDELIFLQTGRLTITLKGPSSHPDFPGVHYDKKSATIRVKSPDDFSISLPGDAGTVDSICALNSYYGSFEVCPLFFEQQTYELFVEPAPGHTVSFWHGNYAIRKQVTPVGREQRMLSGVLNFGNDIGFSDLVFMLDGRDEIVLTLEVFPTKISYKEDYQAIVADITAEVYNLVFDFLKKTYSSFDISKSAQSSPVEFFAIIRTIYDKFVGAADMVLRSPHHQLQKEMEVLSQHKIRQYDGNTVKWLQKHPAEIRKQGEELQIARALTFRKYVTYDTRENRLTKYMLESTVRRLEHFRELYRRIREGNGPDEDAIQNMNAMISGIQRRFPYGNEEEYKEHRFYRSIDKVNIGGLPFLPTATTMVSDMLDDLIDDSTESAFERMSLPRGIEAKLQKVNWNRKDVMIGTLRDRRQLEVCLENKFYYLPVAHLKDEYLPIRTVALYQSVMQFGAEAQITYYGEVKRIQKVKRKEITEVPCAPDRAEQWYYRLEISNWEKLARPIQIKERGLYTSAYTNEFLLKHAETISELFLQSAEEYRFLTELKRFVQNPSIINQDDVPVGFAFDKHRVLFQNGKIYLLHEGNIIDQEDVQAFIRHPNAVFRGLVRSIQGFTTLP